MSTLVPSTGLGAGVSVPTTGLNLIFPIPATKVVLTNTGASPMYVVINGLISDYPTPGDATSGLLAAAPTYPPGSTTPRDLSTFTPVAGTRLGYELAAGDTQTFEGFGPYNSGGLIACIGVISSSGTQTLKGGQTGVFN
jgi:hypothetical protein